MKAEISNFGLHRERRFTGVYQQMGRMLDDRDWNELCEILRDLATTVASEAIGTGVPRHGGLLYGGAPSAFPPTRELLIWNKGGLVAAAGVIGEVLPRDLPPDPEADPGPIYQNQLDLPPAVRVPLAPGRRAPDWSVAGQIPDDAFQPLQQDTRDTQLLYVDIWDRVVTVFETGEGIADDLIDPALHGADTCFRKQRLVQIKAATARDLVLDGDPCLPAFLPARIPTKGNGIFAVQLTAAGQGPDPCDPCAEQVTMTRSVTNHLFRLEVHLVEFDKETREPKQMMLKWSRENGAHELRPGDVTMMSASHSYEYFSDATERLLGMPSDDWVEEKWLRGELDPADPQQVSGVLPRIREWDGWCRLEGGSGNWRVADGRDAGKTLGSAAVMDEGRLTVQPADAGYSFSLALDGKTFLAGDYWLALVRTRAPEDKRVRVVSPTPIGVEHRYCILGTLSSGWGAALPVIAELSSHDLRRLQHPSLTCLDASDMGYATFCQSGLFDAGHDTVKKALDQICKIRAGHVGYSQQCNTSVYSQPDAANVTTVADALDLLCNVSAEQIGYSQQCHRSVYNKSAPDSIKTVADALQLLCDVSADQIGYATTDCQSGLFNAGHDTVKKALDQICQIDATQIKFAPTCKDLKGKTDVAAALEALCKRGEKQDLPRIESVSWRNDAPLMLAEFKQGLTVKFTEKMAGEWLSDDVFVVTWEVPIALKGEGNTTFAEFLTPQIVRGTVNLTEGILATFTPTMTSKDEEAFNGFISLHTQGGGGFDRIRCRVRLLGWSIFDENKTRALDGHVPMKPSEVSTQGGGSLPVITLEDFPNRGIGQPSDFESWFYLIPNPVVRPPRDQGV